VSKREFFCLFFPAWERAFTKKNIKSAWAKAGLFLWNPDRVLEPLKPKDLDLSDSDDNNSENTAPSPPQPEIPTNLI
jgi:hypothetical protein